MRPFCATFIAAVLTPALLLAAEPKLEVEKHRDLVYNPAKDADPVRHKLDLYLPKGSKDYPMLMFVHGGAWKSGNKELYPALGELFAKNGIATAVINYRLSNKSNNVKHPDHIHDVAKAFAWVKDNCGKYGASKDKLYISGHSAGGHLVALLATDESYLKAEQCTTKDIKGVMALSGVYTIVPLILGDIFGKDADVCKAASPMTHVTANHPPFLIAYGNKDLPTLDQMAEQFAKKLQDGKCDAKVLKLERDHISIIVKMATEKDDPLAKAMLEFIKKK
jgi:acetyl esterase/lipase